MPIQPDIDPGCDPIQAPAPTDRTALAYRQGLMAALHGLGSPIRLRRPTAMPWAALRRRRAVALGGRSLRSTCTPIAVATRGGCRWAAALSAPPAPPSRSRDAADGSARGA